MKKPHPRVFKSRKDSRSLSDKVNAMSTKELGKFIGISLSGNLPLADDYSAVPSVLLLELFHQLNPSVRQAFEDILLQDLSDLAQNDLSIWRSDKGDELLLLIAAVFGDSHRQNAPVDLLMYIIEQNWRLRDKLPNLHWRAAQTLVRVGFRAEPEFWRKVYQQGGASYAGPVFAGLSLSDLEDALEWLQAEGSNPAVWNAFMAMIPLLREQYGADRLTPLFRRLLPHIPEAEISDFRELTRDLGMPVMSGALTGLGKTELLKLADELNINIPSDASEKAVRLWIEEQLRKKSRLRHRYSADTPDIEVVSGIADYIGEQGTILLDFRRYFVDYAIRLGPDIDVIEDRVQFFEQVLRIRDDGIDLVQEFDRMTEGL
jgi:hypothetical protein